MNRTDALPCGHDSRTPPRADTAPSDPPPLVSIQR